MTEERFDELRLQRMQKMHRLDVLLLAGELTKAEYDAAVDELYVWAKLEAAFDRAR